MKMSRLIELGFSTGETKVYQAALELGVSTLNGIQEKTGIERRNIYDILNKLIEKGFVSYTIEKGKRTYQITHPNKLLQEIEQKESSLRELKETIPQITELFDAHKPSIRAEVYRGNDSIKALLEESLEYSEQYWIGGNSGVETNTTESMKNWFNHWMKRRVEKKVMMYDLVDYGTSLAGLKPKDSKTHKKNFYKYSQLPKHLQSPIVILIFGNKVAQILWSGQSFAFVLEAAEIKESFMKYFKHFWKES